MPNEININDLEINQEVQDFLRKLEEIEEDINHDVSFIELEIDLGELSDEAFERITNINPPENS